MRDGLLAETVRFPGHGGDLVEGYLARPLTPGPVPGVVVVHHAPGLDPWCREVTRDLAAEGYATLAPHLYHRRGPGDWADVAAAARADGLEVAMPDAQVTGDLAGAVTHLKTLVGSNGKVGIIGFCSGGRQAFLAACDVPALDAAVDCWGGNIDPDVDPHDPQRRRAPGTLHRAPDVAAPLLGLFGNDDPNPSPEQVDRLDAALTEHGRDHEFHRFDGAGHGFFDVGKAGYRQAQAVEGWRRVHDFFHRTLT